MMAKLTPDQLKKLTPKQQEAIADFEMIRARQRLAMLRQAQGYYGKLLFPLLLFLVVGGIAIFHLGDLRLIPLGFIGLACLVQFHAAGLNQRLDALMELLDRDIKKAAAGDDDRTA